MPQISQKLNVSQESASAIVIILFSALFILANFLIGFNLPLYVLAMLIAFFLSVKHPRAGLFSIVFLTIIFERFFTLSPIFFNKVEFKIYPIDIIMIGVSIGIFIEWLTKQRNFKIQKSDWFLIGFIFYNVIYFAYSFIAGTDINLSFSSLKNYAFYSLLYFMVSMLIKTKEDLKKLFRFFMAGAIMLIGFIFFGILNDSGLWTEYTPLTTSGVRILAFTHGLYLSMAFIAAIIYFIYRKIENKLILVLTALWAIGIIGTLMRHLWIGLVASFIIIYLFLPKEQSARLKFFGRKYAISVIGAGILLLYVALIFPQSSLTISLTKTWKAVSERGISIANAREDESFAWRELVWNSAYKEFKLNPILGIGTGRNIFVETENYKDFVEVRNIHNSFLAIIIQLGILGFAFLVALIFQNIKKLIKLANEKEYSLAILGILVLFLVAFNFQPYLETNLLSIFFWMALGTVNSLRHKREI